MHDVNEGYNAYLTADPEDGGAPAGYHGMPSQGAVPPWQDVVNNDGSGWLYGEIQQELKFDGIHDIGLIGYSHGGGMIANISQKLKDDPNTPKTAKVVFAATIDAVQYGTGPDGGLNGGWHNNHPLATSPVQIWGGTGFNYYESTGYSGILGLNTRDYGVPVNGVSMPGVSDFPVEYDNHSTIGTDKGVLLGVENDTDQVMFALSS